VFVQRIDDNKRVQATQRRVERGRRETTHRCSMASRPRAVARASASDGWAGASSADIRSSKKSGGTLVVDACSAMTSSARLSAAARTNSLTGV
jgi:hypothetical protein